MDNHSRATPRYSGNDCIGWSTWGSRVPNVLVRAGTPEYLLANILNERNSTLRQSLHMLPNYEDTVKMISETLAEI